MSDRQRTFFGSIIASLLSLCGCNQPAAPMNANGDQPTVIEEIAVQGFDPEGEPVIKKWSDGSISIHFEAMPPFFAEDNGTEADFETFEKTMRENYALISHTTRSYVLI